MDSTLVAAALLSAALHAAWNAGVKSSANPPLAMTAQRLASAVLAVPVWFWTGLPAAASWPFMALSTTLGMGAVASLQRACRYAGFGVVYPMARASSVRLVLPLAAAMAGEWPRPLGLAGVARVIVVRGGSATVLQPDGSSSTRPTRATMRNACSVSTWCRQATGTAHRQITHNEFHFRASCPAPTSTTRPSRRRAARR